MADRWRVPDRSSGGTDRLEGRRLYLCVGDRPDLLELVEACVAGGVDLIQLREKQAPAAVVLERAVELVALCRRLGVPFILNDRPDLALACGADGVHVGQDDAPPALARRILGPGAIVGRSTHAPEQLAGAAAEPVDYVSAGPVVATPTKPGRAGVGLDYVRHAAAHAPVPFYVTGGVAPDTVAEMAAAGAERFVVVRWLTEASDPESAARALRTAIDGALAEV